jgi:hypothetical protein
MVRREARRSRQNAIELALSWTGGRPSAAEALR